jgi:hypothetical protein
VTVEGSFIQTKGVLGLSKTSRVTGTRRTNTTTEGGEGYKGPIADDKDVGIHLCALLLL